jgi:hypothetical protein
MIPGCTEPKYADMLHAFELGMLSDADRERLEIHLLKCEHCFEKAKALKPATRLLRDDPDVRQFIIQAAEERDLSKQRRPRILNLLWPEKPRFVLPKPLSLLILLVVLSYPVYRLGFHKSPGYTQTVNLFPMRGGGQSMVSLEKGGDVIINFVFEQAVPGKDYRIVLAARDSDVVYSDDDFADFNRSGLGTVRLPVNRFKEGDYVLEIYDPALDKAENRVVYYFKAE